MHCIVFIVEINKYELYNKQIIYGTTTSYTRFQLHDDQLGIRKDCCFHCHCLPLLCIQSVSAAELDILAAGHGKYYNGPSDFGKNQFNCGQSKIHNWHRHSLLVIKIARKIEF